MNDFNKIALVMLGVCVVFGALGNLGPVAYLLKAALTLAGGVIVLAVAVVVGVGVWAVVQGKKAARSLHRINSGFPDE